MDPSSQQVSLSRLPEQLVEARQLITRSQLPAAAGILQPLRELLPEHEQLIQLWGMLKQHQGNLLEAIAAYNHRLQLLPDSASAMNDLAAVYIQAGESDEALDLLQQALRLQPDNHQARFNLARVLKARGDMKGALTEIEQVIQLQPELFGARILAGDINKALGSLPAAERQFRAAIDSNPEHGAGWWSLSNTKTTQLSDADLERIRGLLAADTRPENAVYLHFALAKGLEDRRDYAAAFEQFRAGNRIRKQQGQWDAARFHQWLGKIIDTSRNLPVPDRSKPLNPPRPIFIVSLPRSGSTLTEQILASHSQVAGADELPYIQQIIGAESRRRGQDFSHWMGQVTTEEWHRLGQQYLDQTERWWRSSPVFCDKLPGNFTHLGLILNMLPNALVVICRRDPRDACLSCYRQLFVRGQNFSYDLADLARYYQDFDHACNFWQQRSPERVYSLIYEDLVTDTEVQIRRLLDFCALEWDPACLAFHASDRAVATASAAQVRQPIHRGNIGFWKNYQPYIGELLDGLTAGSG